jgi:hypothetical protein
LFGGRRGALDFSDLELLLEIKREEQKGRWPWSESWMQFISFIIIMLSLLYSV